MENPFDEKHLRRTAYHEAGHAVAASVLGLPFEKVTMLLAFPEGGHYEGQSLGKVHRETDMPALSRRLDLAQDQLIQMLAGPLSEARSEVGLPIDWTQDHKDIDRVLRFTFCQFVLSGTSATFSPVDVAAHRTEMDAFRDRCVLLAQQFVDERLEVIGKVASALLEHGELTCREVARLCTC